MTSKADELRLDRERSLGLLYEMEMKQVDASTLLDDLPAPVSANVSQVIRGVDATSQDLEALIVANAKGWDFERMATIDRCVMRFATWELVNRLDLSVAVIINEAVDLAKRFSTDDSGKFVNGVLDAIAKQVRT